jgi:hypothetical protein
MMTSLVGNLVYSSLKTSFVDFATSISPSSTNPVPSWISSSQIYSTLANDTGIQTCISSVNTIYTCNSEKRQSSSRQFLQALLTWNVLVKKYVLSHRLLIVTWQSNYPIISPYRLN